MVTLTVLMGIPSRLGASADQVRSSGRPLDRPSHSPGWPGPLSWLQQVPRHHFSPFPPLGAPHLLRHGGGTTPKPRHPPPPASGPRSQTPGFRPQPGHSQLCDRPARVPPCTQVVIYRCADLTGLSSQQRSGPEPRGPRSSSWQGSGEVWL